MGTQRRYHFNEVMGCGDIRRRDVCTDGVITSFIQRQTSDIHAGNGDPVMDVQYDTSSHQVQKKTLTSPAWATITGGQAEIES